MVNPALTAGTDNVSAGTERSNQRISQNDVVRQAVPKLGSSNWEGSTANCREFNWWHNKTVGDSRMEHSSTRDIDAEEWTKMAHFHVGPCTPEQPACTVRTLGPTTSEG